MRIELGKMVRSRLFWLALVLCTAIACAAAAQGVAVYLEYGQMAFDLMVKAYQIPFTFSPFTYWICVDFAQFWSNLFMFVAPLFIALAFSWSLRTELHDGYAQQIFLYVVRPRYYTAKAIATFVAGGAVAAVPLVVNFLILACFMPLYIPQIDAVSMVGVYEIVPFSSLFYRCPLGFVALRTAIDFVLAGLWATVVLGLSTFVRNRIVLVALPYLALVLAKFATEYLYLLLGVHGQSVVLIDLLRMSGDTFNYTWRTLAVVALAMAAVSVVLPWCARKRDVL